MEATAGTAPAWYHVYYTDASSNNYLMLIVLLGVIFGLVALARWAQHKWKPFMWNKTGTITLTPKVSEVVPTPIPPNIDIDHALRMLPTTPIQP